MLNVECSKREGTTKYSGARRLTTTDNNNNINIGMYSILASDELPSEGLSKE